MTHVVCVGDLMADVLALLPGPLARGTDTPATVRILGGGAAANAAAWVAAAGGVATFVGRVGDDELGRQAVAQLEQAGVDARVEADPDRPTGTCIVLVDPSGERTMVPSAGANAAAFDPELLPEHADWLLLSGYSLLRDESRASALAVLTLGRERGWAIAVDAASAGPLHEVGAESFLDRLGTGIVLLANGAEARVLTGEVDPAAAARTLARRLGAAVVKIGSGGAVWSDARRVCSIPAMPAEVVDTTGAGDAFAAGFLTASGSGASRLMRALHCARHAVAQAGGRPMLPVSG
ncbi:MAG TPA: carbohydrate kinase family protein [Jatrophihabitans sp.]|nr:carbohydrate kinase family protein [Jatrophihabitans sp.]